MTVPVVDLSLFRHGTSRDKWSVAAEFDRACRDIGFLVVSGHGVPQSVQTTLYETGKALFDQPLSHKLKARRPHSEQNRGYIPYGEERLVCMHGGDSPPDFKEVFAMGPYAVPDELYYTQAAAYPNFAPNIWPACAPLLRTAMETYYRAMETLTHTLLRVAALALELPEDWFDLKLDRHTSHLRLLHYPAPEGELESGQLRCGEHTDLGALTILRNEAVPGGLEVCDRDGYWVAAPALCNTFVVNIGDLMMRWTNDRWTSTPHRVVVPPDDLRHVSRRLSIAHFVRPNFDAPIVCIPTCASADNPPRYEVTTLQDYAVARFAAGAGPQPTEDESVQNGSQ
ncbi:MAG: 2-oxoglutarate and iron-dependent oxygenase domain-containing protein [Candidatus Tectomicrobia bacterium]